MTLRRSMPFWARKKAESGGAWLSGFAPDFAWSIRQPTTDSNLCIRIKETGSDTIQDFNWVNGEIDIISIQSFVGSNDGCVVRIYSSLHSSDYFYNETGSQEPRIIVGGVLQTFAGKPTIFFDDIRQDFLLGTSNFIPSVSDGAGGNSIVYSHELLKTGGSVFINTQSSASPRGFSSQSGSSSTSVSALYQPASELNKIIINQIDENPSTRGDVYTLLNGEKIVSEQNIGINSLFGLRLGNYANASFKMKANVSDFIAFNSVQTVSDLKSIQSIMNSYYSIY